jgi:hypothetical protein
MQSRGRSWTVVAALASFGGAAAGVLACGDDTQVAPADAGPDASLESDAGGFETGAFDAYELPDGSTGTGEAGAPPPARLLLSYSTTAQSQLDVFGLRSATVDGQLSYSGAAGTVVTTNSSPWLLEQASEVVVRLDPIQPWIVRSSWNVANGAMGNTADAGFSTPYSDPDAVLVTTGTQAYVLLGNRNHVAVIDTSMDVDGGAPSATIDLSGQVQAGGDGVVEMVAGYFDPVSNDAYVLLGNVNRSIVGPDGHTLGCSSTNPTVVAIDTATNAVVAPAVGDAGTSGFALQGYDPAPGPSPMVYDPANNRLLVLESGCVPLGTDGGAGPVTRRGVEAVSLTDGSVTQLLDLSSQPPPQGIFYIDQHHVVLQLGSAFMWDPAAASLGPAIANAPQTFALDGQGDLVGVSPQVASDGGAAGWSVVSVSTGDGGVTTLGQNPFSLSGGSVGGVALWPPP